MDATGFVYGQNFEKKILGNIQRMFKSWPERQIWKAVT